MVFNNNDNKLGFLHKKLDMNHTALAYWISLDEFSERIEAMIADGISIEPQPVFEIMKDIYIRYEKEREESPDKLDFNFYLARGGIKSLWKSMTGSTEGWR